MTSEEYDKLSDEEKRIKVAELCGWTRWAERVGFWADPYPDGEYHQDLPNYLNDLNACHEFEKICFKQHGARPYIRHLKTTFAPRINADTGVVSATAEQRCKAFVLTMTGGE